MVQKEKQIQAAAREAEQTKRELTELKAKQAKQEEASRQQQLDMQQIKALLQKNSKNQVDLLLKTLSKINRDEVVSTARAKDFILSKLGDLTHGEIGYNPDLDGVSMIPLD